MKILVCISKTPDTTAKIAFTDNNTKFDNNGVQWIINPYDDVSFRRVVNVPARGIGKSVMDALDAIDPDGELQSTPLLNAGLQPSPSPRSMWARLHAALDRKQLPSRALTALRTFRDLIAGLSSEAGGKSVSIMLGLVLDRTGYLQGLREERSEEAEGRIKTTKVCEEGAMEAPVRERESTTTIIKR